MRTKLVFQVGPVTTEASKSERRLKGSLCSIVIMLAVLFAIGCARADKENSTSTTSDVAQKTTVDKSRSEPQAHSACELLTANDIAAILKVPQVKKDEFSSGKNEITKVDFCYWYPNAKVNNDRDERIEVRLRRAESADEGSLLMLFSAAKGDAVEHDIERDRTAQPVPGVGDEAIYSPYPDGGSIALRAGTSAVTISGLLTKDKLVSMAKLAAQRL